MEIILTQLEARSFFLSTNASPAAADRSLALNYGARRISSQASRAALSAQNRYQNTDEVPASDKPIPQSTESDGDGSELPDSNLGDARKPPANPGDTDERVEGLPDADRQADRVDTDSPLPPPVANPH